MGLRLKAYVCKLRLFYMIKRLFLLLNITLLGGPHIGRALPQDGFFYPIDSRGTEDIAYPGTMGGTGIMKGVFRETRDTVFLPVAVWGGGQGANFV
jgi:hypothetical protein